MIDETPLLDIKSYIEKFDAVKDKASGWMSANMQEISEKRSDTRFK